MPLAAISFSDPLMLAGLLAATLPVILHLLNRMRAPVVPFPTLRFLRLTAEKTVRRRQIQHYFLLLVRVIVFALMAMAVASPLIRGGSASLAYGLVGMLLGGLALLVLAGVLGAAAIKPSKKSPPKVSAGSAAPPPPNYALRWFVSGAMLVAALSLLGFGTYGLASDRYFSRERGEFSGRSTAMVIIFDNSHSMLAIDGAQSRLARAKAQARQLLGQSLQPAEATLLPTNPGDQPDAPGLTGDMTRLAGMLDSLVPRGTARPMRERIQTALALLKASAQPGKMLVIISDFTREPFADAEVFATLKSLPWRQDLQLVLMPITGTPEGISDAGIVAFAPAAGTQRPALGAEVTFEAQIVNNAFVPDVRDFVLTVDGKPVEGNGPLTPRVALGAGGTAAGLSVVKIPYRLTEAGIHVFGLETRDRQDAMAWDDRREFALDVADQVRVLVVGGEAADARGMPRPRTAAFYFMAALAPYDTSGPRAVPWSIKPVYKGAAELSGAANLSDYAAIFLCDVPQVSAPLADALAAYGRGGNGTTGGRIIWVLGPNVDTASYNDVLLSGGRQLLPAPLGHAINESKALTLDWVDLRAGVFTDLFEGQDPFHSVLVTGHWKFAASEDAANGRVLARLAGDEPLLMQHSLAANTTGRVFTLLTSPSAAWSNLGGTVLVVPLASRMALGDFQELGRTDYSEGVAVTISLPTAAVDARISLDVTQPDSSVINVKPAAGGRWYFDRTLATGAYRWKTTDGKQAGAFVVNPPGEEADLAAADVSALAKEADRGAETATPTIVAPTVPEFLAQMARRSEGTSLAPGFIAMVLILAVVEAMMANRVR